MSPSARYIRQGAGCFLHFWRTENARISLIAGDRFACRRRRSRARGERINIGRGLGHARTYGSSGTGDAPCSFCGLSPRSSSRLTGQQRLPRHPEAPHAFHGVAPCRSVAAQPSLPHQLLPPSFSSLPFRPGLPPKAQGRANRWSAACTTCWPVWREPRCRKTRLAPRLSRTAMASCGPCSRRLSKTAKPLSARSIGASAWRANAPPREQDWLTGSGSDEGSRSSGLANHGRLVRRGRPSSGALNLSDQLLERRPRPGPVRLVKSASSKSSSV